MHHLRDITSISADRQFSMYFLAVEKKAYEVKIQKKIKKQIDKLIKPRVKTRCLFYDTFKYFLSFCFFFSLYR
jgi:hypothetical protein